MLNHGRFVMTAIFVLSLVVPRTSLGARTCEDLFKKEGFISPSVRITETGRIEAKLTNSKSVLGRFLNSITRIVYKPLSLDKIETVTERLMADTRADVPFWIKLSEAFRLDIQIDPRALEHIPTTGPLVIVSNHAMNGVEGIALAALVSRVRPDIKVVMTNLLDVVPNMAANSIFANPYGGETARLANIQARRQMTEELENGHAFIIFPSGTVSGKTKWSDTMALDGQWKKGVAELVAAVPKAQVLPIFVEGQPSQTFQNMTLIADRMPKKLQGLRTGIGAVFHIREIGNRVDQTVGLVVGQPVAGTEVTSWGNASSIMENLKRLTYDLRANRETKISLANHSVPISVERAAAEKRREEIAPPVRMDVVHAELLNKGKVIYDMAPEARDKRMKVFVARGRDIPRTLEEIGRLREITFRAVGEGSGKARDLDQYDVDYFHLIAIDKKSGLIAGGYRIGRVDELLAKRGYQGIYTSAFFNHSALLNSYLGVSLELGRSFVVPEFQRSFALMALFNGIGHYVAQNPQYKYLMGPVSISNEVSERSKGILLAYLQKHHESPDAHLVHPLTPLKKDYEISVDDRAFVNSVVDVRALARRVDEIEKEAGTGNTTPPLIPIYVGLGAKFFKFNLDADFNTIDGLIVTDLSRLRLEDLKNYMGVEKATKFLDYHNGASRRDFSNASGQ